ncbi:MAG: hypothetical protein JWQ96_1255 [Segetibacter sp.]|nr:hypothetical protein [Segetibacter sp.]
MKKTSLLLLIISVLFFQCSKDSGSSSEATAVGGETGAGGSMARFAIVGNYLYTVDHQKLRVYEITNAAEPVLKNTVNIGIEIETIYPFKDKLFIGSTTAVHILSISDPVKPEKLSTAISPQVMRRCDPVVAKDNVAYATLRTNGFCGGVQSILAVYDITDVTKPISKNSINVTEPYGLGYSGNVLYVCDKFQGLMLYNITQPYQPTFIKSLRDGSYIDVICYQNTMICWVADGVLLYDITNNTNPALLAKID